MKPRIVVIGSVNVDLVIRCPHLPVPGETVTGSDLQILHGGKGANQAVAAARLGAEVHFFGCVGDDGFGRSARAALESEGIDTSGLLTLPGVATGAAQIQVDPQGRNCIALAPGANARLTPGHLAAASAAIDGASMVICQLESPLAAVAAAASLAQHMGVPLLLNPAPARELPAALLAQVHWLVPNEGEARLLAGPRAADAGGETLAQALRAAGPQGVIVTLAERGVAVADAQGARHFPGHAVAAMDSTGAGDTFVGAFAVGRARGLSADESIAFAQRAAAWSVQRPGAQAAMPRLAELGGVSPLEPTA
jgi:ribokinase